MTLKQAKARFEKTTCFRDAVAGAEYPTLVREDMMAAFKLGWGAGKASRWKRLDHAGKVVVSPVPAQLSNSFL